MNTDDNGLQGWIDTLEAFEDDRCPEDAQLLMLLLELRRRRLNDKENQQ